MPMPQDALARIDEPVSYHETDADFQVVSAAGVIAAAFHDEHRDNGQANCERLVACWNACLNMQDPVAEVQRLAAAAAAFKLALQNIVDMHSSPTAPTGGAVTRVARAALYGKEVA